MHALFRNLKRTGQIGYAFAYFKALSDLLISVLLSCVFEIQRKCRWKLSIQQPNYAARCLGNIVYGCDLKAPMGHTAVSMQANSKEPIRVAG